MSDTNDHLVLKWLDDAGLSAVYDVEAARLTLAYPSGEKVADVKVGQAFPVTQPGAYLDFSDSKGEPVGMLRSMESLDADSRRAIAAALATRCLIPIIESVAALDEITPAVILWRVRTDRGERTFHTESPREAVRFLAADRIRITDLAGNLYDIPSLARLDASSRELLDLLI